MGTLRYLFLLVDLGFIAYWTITALGLIPPEYAFQDYTNPFLTIWNWSFLPLDLLVSGTGLAALACHRRGSELWRPLAMLSLAFTMASGLQAVSFWAIQGFFDPTWWGLNLFLLVYPLFFLPRLVRPVT
ncbi:MAG: DUF5360 family protein [Spirochaetales bacterium]|nr:DUF5360 family protein [Leptospiraceae bacterium]MCP5482081.1 DUF5360 family protein [Spirochaetales bacterium]MCP5484963.1 DUF5360 family protein [Spirochaetales bacterium]